MEIGFLLGWIAVLLRIVIGILFLAHGFPKLRSPERAATHLLKLGIPWPMLTAIIIGVIEFFGGIALVIGFETMIMSTLLAVIMLVGAVKRKIKLKEEVWFELLMAAMLIALIIIIGAGYYSIDERFGWLLGKSLF